MQVARCIGVSALFQGPGTGHLTGNHRVRNPIESSRGYSFCCVERGLGDGRKTHWWLPVRLAGYAPTRVDKRLSGVLSCNAAVKKGNGHQTMWIASGSAPASTLPPSADCAFPSFCSGFLSTRTATVPPAQVLIDLSSASTECGVAHGGVRWEKYLRGS